MLNKQITLSLLVLVAATLTARAGLGTSSQYNSGGVNVTSQVTAAQKASQALLNSGTMRNPINTFYASLGLSKTPFYVAPNTWVSPSYNGTLTKWSVTTKPVR